MFRFVQSSLNITTLLVNGMEKRRVILCAVNSELGEVDIM